jgi:hypothetical protein
LPDGPEARLPKSEIDVEEQAFLAHSDSLDVLGVLERAES